MPSNVVAEISDALRSVAAGAVKRRGHSDRVWEIDGDSVAQVALKATILRISIESGATLLYDEPLDDAKLAETLVDLGSGQYRLTAATSLASLADWLYLGNWQIVLPSCPGTTIDAARATEAVICQYLDSNGLKLLVDSFHDDIEWVVALS